MCSMSALDEAIKLCRAEELKITDTIRQYKDILHAMKTRVNVSSETETQASLNDDIPLKEREEIELLEQVLKKALKIRSSSAVGSTFQEKTCSTGTAKKALSVNDCDKRKSSSSAESKGSRQRARPLKSSADCGDNPTHKILGKTPAPSSCSTIKGTQSAVKKSYLVQEKTRQCEASAAKEQWVPSASLPLWQAQRAKKEKLWNKVLISHSKPVPERDHFKKKIVGTFPTDWTAAHVAAMEAELDVLTQLGLDLTYCYNAALRRHQMGCPEPSTEKEYESLLMLRGLKKMKVQVIKEADRLEKDWKSKMAWRHEALCPLRSRVEWHHLLQPCPPTLVYSNKAEMEDLHSLSLQVAELKLEIHMHQVMCGKLLDLIPCDSASSWHLNATALRGVYSLLGEGGNQFPSLVLDTDSNQT